MNRVSRRERELPTFSLILRDENENFPSQSWASGRDREIQSLYLEIRNDIEKIFRPFSVLIMEKKVKSNLCNRYNLKIAIMFFGPPTLALGGVKTEKVGVLLDNKKCLCS